MYLNFQFFKIFFLAKGRTNLELREQLSLAPGASPSMVAFKSKRQLPKVPRVPIIRVDSNNNSGSDVDSVKFNQRF